MDNKAAWDALPKREQQEKESELRQQSESAAAAVTMYRDTHCQKDLVLLACD